MNLHAIGGVLAENNFGDTRSGDGLVGPMALLLILLLAVAMILLIRNMSKKIKRLPESFDETAEPPAPGTNH